MSNTNGYNTLTKSMNGIITVSDGMGTVIEDDTVTTDTVICTTFETDNLNVNNIQGKLPTDNITLYTNTTGNIRIGDNSAINTITGTTLNLKSYDSVVIDSINDTDIISGQNLYFDTVGTTTMTGTKIIIGGSQNIQPLNLGSPSYLFTDSTNEIHIGSPNSLNYIDGPLYVDNIFGTTTGTVFIYPNVVDDINIGSSIIPIVGSYVCTQPTHLANKSYVDSKVAVDLIPLPNVWTGTSNTFNNKIVLNAIDALSAGATVDLFPNLSTGTINFGVNATSAGAINIGNASATGTFSVSEGTININPKTTLNMANQIGTGTVNICNANTYQGTLNIASTANTNGLLTNALNIGSSTSNITIKAGSISIDSNNDIDIKKPLSPGYSVFANVGTSAVNTIGYIEGGTFNTGTIAMGVDTYHNLDTVGLTSAGVYMVNFNVTLRNNSGTVTTLVYYLHIQIGTSTGASDVYEGWFNQYSTLAVTGSPNPRLDCMHSFIYTATAPQTLSLTGQIGRTNPTNYIGTTSFFRAVRIA